MLNLNGKNALVTGIANNRSIAWGIAQQLHQAGANLGITYLPDEKGRFEKKVQELVEPLNPSLFLPCDVQNDTQIEELFTAIRDQWGRIDILIHCLAFAGKEELSGDFSNVSRAGFTRALDISAYSLVQLSGAAKPLMTQGGSIITLTYLGGVRVIPNYNVMGIAKAALEMNVRYLAAELGPLGVRVNGISAGPIRTLASSAVGGILDMIHHVEEIAPLKRTVTQTEVGNAAAFLSSDLSSGITGQILYVDSGYCIMGM
ncbi:MULTISPECIES: enoyl-ACP reductase FabI [Planktothrix]|jgi:enoyl-[acyl-carrier protein] reductase I|uniref:Enoyl-[acyl-carrier-protein] reductase [NADH] n=2 Tax=Planktothrix TaxID=54304 RepID=A0A479ZQZ2_PLAAG|nr:MULTISPECIES: enoyl-ACP reductase FabI [Planktothrix]CAD5973125.1 Enoyl-[acyl-carrier-protein] reductase [NADH] FabI [Planktothrix rubescens]CAC5342606.1 Enoyl-(acyl-carrier-protein) reductase (NADH) FabI [Planktothrix rubescens NIVA-CYA 18]CAD0233102.1 Enoyl-(acyl-carrier-protein) reductase (NADH) FabI [Planktothrix agardhii]CAD5972065.1 Enoyl-[acyl-carrier-protein] reductase [NADH] FabI [Planktothrix rubescens NIVA-CYA 18]CAD5977907.1 Enoyl-[acyl-carrier-protein] reductase [NADH] FabI [Pl